MDRLPSISPDTLRKLPSSYAPRQFIISGNLQSYRVLKGANNEINIRIDVPGASVVEWEYEKDKRMLHFHCFQTEEQKMAKEQLRSYLGAVEFKCKLVSGSITCKCEKGILIILVTRDDPHKYTRKEVVLYKCADKSFKYNPFLYQGNDSYYQCYFTDEKLIFAADVPGLPDTDESEIKAEGGKVTFTENDNQLMVSQSYKVGLQLDESHFGLATAQVLHGILSITIPRTKSNVAEPQIHLDIGNGVKLKLKPEY